MQAISIVSSVVGGRKKDYPQGFSIATENATFLIG
jgi:hypothetical protein